METFTKTYKFVDWANEEQEKIKSSIIYNGFNESFEKKHGVKNPSRMIEITPFAYSKSDIREEIIASLGDDTQADFDTAKRILNKFDFNISLDETNKITDKATRENTLHCLAELFGKCLDVRDMIYDLMRRYNLKNNYPKNGFLIPYDEEDEHEEEIAASQPKAPEPQQESTDKSGVVSNIYNTTISFNIDKSAYKKIFECLVRYNVIDETYDIFLQHLKHGDFSEEYSKKNRKLYLRKFCANMLYSVKKEDKDDFKKRLKKCMHLKNVNDITRHNTLKSDEYQKYCEELVRIL